MPAQPAPERRRTTGPPAAGPKARRATSPTRWVPVSELSTLARMLLSEDLGGRDVVPGHVADRVTSLADQWAAHGFTEEAVRPWMELPPDAANYLASRGVNSAVLDRPFGALRGAATVTFGAAIASGQLPVEQAYDLLVLTGEHKPEQTDQSKPEGTEPTDDAPRRAVAPALFSHPATDRPTHDPAESPPQEGNRPTRSPFSH